MAAFYPITPHIEGVEIISDPGPFLSYAPGDLNVVAVTFDEPIAVDTTGGVPYLPLKIGRDTRHAAYAAIDSNRRILTFWHTVTDEDRDLNGLVIAADSLTLKGGSITYPDTANDAYLAHEVLPDLADHRVNAP